MTLPTGTVTFLFTDIEGSASLWERFPAAMQAALARHDAVLRGAIEAQNGVVVKSTGDGCLAAFHTAPEALAAILTIQLKLYAEDWPAGTPLKVRAALHTGVAELREGDYFGTTLNRAARLLATGYGGQTLVSAVTQELARDSLPPDVTLCALGVHRLKDLQRPETVYQLLHPDLTLEFPPLRSLSNPDSPNNLPQQTTSFIGREAALAEVKSLLKKTRLLTLTGSGGSGKTRLGLQAAAEMLDGMDDGVWFAELAPIASAALVAQTVANALGVKEQPGKPILQTLLDYLKPKRLLLLLDNCEHLINAVAHFADALLKNCPNITLLATSREGLNIAGEVAYRVPSLSLPTLPPSIPPSQVGKISALPPSQGGTKGGSASAQGGFTPESLNQFEAVRLFIERALQAQTNFTVTNDNAPALAQLCVQLDGIPLAIELAAARVRSLSVEEINGRLDNCFRLLTGGPRAALPRQQTLRALIDWSYDLLNAQEKALFYRLSGFAGGWTLEAAEQVGISESSEGAIEAWEVFDLLTGLADKSLVVAESGVATRYRLLETMKQYATEKLRESGEEADTRDRHLAFYLALAEEAGPELRRPEVAEWLNRLETEHDNLRAALTWASEAAQRAGAGLKMGSALTLFWVMRGFTNEGLLMMTRALSGANAAIPALTRAQAFNSAGTMAFHQSDFVRAKDCYQKSLILHQEAGNHASATAVLNNLGTLAHGQGDYATAKEMYEKSLAIKRETGIRQGQEVNLTNLAAVAIEQSDYAAAQRLSEEALQICHETGNRQQQIACYFTLGSVGMAQGESAMAKKFLREGLILARTLGHKPSIIISLELSANLRAQQGQPERAARLWGATKAARAEIGMLMTPKQQVDYDRHVKEARQAADTAAFDAAWAAGALLSTEQTIELVLEED